VTKKLLLHYSASSNISYRGTWEVPLDDDWDPTDEEIDEIILDMIFNDVDVHTEVVEE
jgi:hypothetical protein